MKLPDPAVLQKVKQWLAYADEDLRFAQHGFSLGDFPPHHLIAYHEAVSETEARRAVEIAGHVCQIVRSSLREEGLEIPG